MATLGSIAVKYWVEFVFGLVVTGLTIFFRHYLKLRKMEQEKGRAEFLNTIKTEISSVYDKSKEDDDVLQYEIDSLKGEMDSLKAGVLSMQGKEFKAQCRRLLADDHEITLDEWEEIDSDHDAYNGLGGNHKGDHLFELVKKKAENTLTIVK